MQLFKKTAIGLDMDTFEARAVQLTGRPGAAKFTAFSRISLPEGVVREGVIVDPRKAGQSLRSLWQQAGFRRRDVVLGVSNQGVLVRFASFPRVPPEKLGNLIRFQAQDFLPVPLASVVLDYMVVGQNRAREGQEEQEVLLVAARREMVDGFLSALETADLEPREMDVSSLSLLRLIPPEDRQGAVAVVHLPYEIGNILIGARGVPRLARLIPFSLTSLLGREHLQEVATCAELDCSGRIGDKIRVFIETLASEIRSSIDYYYSQEGALAVEKIYLGGSVSLIPGLFDQLQARLDIPLVDLDPLRGLEVSSQAAAALQGRAAVFNVNISLALRGLEARA